MWFLLACIGVEMLHSLLEYPLWYAHFLGLSALLMGVSMPKTIELWPKISRAVFGLGAALGILLLSLCLAAYLRFDAASPVAAGRSLASDSVIAAEREALAQVSRGLLGVRAETWLFLAYPLDGNELDQKVSAGRRVMRTWPSREVVCRQAIFLALAGHKDQATETVTRAVRTFPNFSQKCTEATESSPPSAPEILLPILR